jgi:CheY-like chemotaxis protein
MDPSQIDQILTNLCVNARDAITDVGKITIKTENRAYSKEYCVQHPTYMHGKYVLLTVSDNGRGMDKETLRHVFEPFFTTKETGKGTGLGLATIYGIVKQNNGFVHVDSRSGQGTTFEIFLPRHITRDSENPIETVVKSDTSGQATILLVEDEPAILRLTARMLEEQGDMVLAARTPGEAMRLAREYSGEIQILMTDVVMPEMNGRELAKNLQSLYPHLKCVFMSGWTADVIAHKGVLEPGTHFLQKPFAMKELVALIQKVKK